ncbi:MAG: hypothetical protein JST43_02535 [Bacteroidetes bacterium]|nr:hypothetical protein [Bacteroidota bacterium]MBS1541146.1 hypothetical protein [Bacteroidota bacterium]
MVRLLFLAWLLSAVGFCYAQNSEQSVSLIDASTWSVDGSPFRIEGPASFYEDKIVAPEDCARQPSSVTYFPRLWGEKENGTPIEVGTYLIKVLLPPNTTDSLALAMPTMYSSFSLYVNGKLIAQNGNVGLTREKTKPQWLPLTASFKPAGDTLSLVLQIANFYHYKAGIKNPIFLSSAHQIKYKSKIITLFNTIEFSVLMITAVFFFFIFLIVQKKEAALYFALLCATWSVRSVFSNNYLFTALYPDFSWLATVRIEYLTLYFTMIWAVLFAGNLFQNETNLIIKYTFILANLVFIIFTLSTDTRLFTKGLNIYLITSGLLLAYVGYIVIRAWVNERTGSGILTLSIIFGLILFSYDIFVYQGFSTYNPVIFGIGYIILFMMLGWALSMQMNLVKSRRPPTNSLTYDDLYKNEK